MAALGRLRDAVRQELVRRQLREVLGDDTSARVLDVGCGQGTQVLHLARAGYEAVGLDPGEELLAALDASLAGESDDVRRRVTTVLGAGERAAELVDGRFDVILCHGVLMYLDDPTALLTAISAVATPGARLSLLVRNGHALAMRDGLLGRWDEALAQFDATTYTNRLGLDARAHTLEELDALLSPLGWQRDRWYGVRVVTDHLDEPAPSADELERTLPNCATG